LSNGFLLRGVAGSNPAGIASSFSLSKVFN
jgi:hypothetical protein